MPQSRALKELKMAKEAILAQNNLQNNSAAGEDNFVKSEPIAGSGGGEAKGMAMSAAGGAVKGAVSHGLKAGLGKAAAAGAGKALAKTGLGVLIKAVAAFL
jgi:hypothetical protein